MNLANDLPHCKYSRSGIDHYFTEVIDKLDLVFSDR